MLAGADHGGTLLKKKYFLLANPKLQTTPYVLVLITCNQLEPIIYHLNHFVMQVKKTIAWVLSTLLTGSLSFAQPMNQPVNVGGAAMYPSKNIIENAMHSKDHTTLVDAVKAAGLVETLESTGPFTVFAPTNEAFDLLPSGTVEMLLKPENKMKLTAILTYHVVAGRLDYAALAAQINAGHGTAQLKTVQGGTLWIMMSGNDLVLKDENGGMARITIKDVYQSNGVIHVIDHIVTPKS